MELKYLEAKQASADVLLDNIEEEIYPIKFKVIDEESLRQCLLKTGRSGPLGLDAYSWRRI